MSDSVHCPQCGSLLSADSADGLCPKCLLTVALETNCLADTAPMRAIVETLVPQFGAYKVVRLLGQGGMGVVYLADQQHPIRRLVALKVIKLGMDTKEVIARFESERQALAMMDHANIARVFDAGISAEGRPYFAMEYVPGIPITEYCDKNLLNNNERMELFISVCQAVQHAHQKGVVHRDIKPSNVLVSAQDGQLVPKVIDFGVAKAMNDGVTERTFFTEQGRLIGTPEYMSPEQAEADGRDVDATTDIYSLGILLYELLVGVLPFDPKALRAAGYEEIRRIIREEETPRPTTRLQSLGAKAMEVATCRGTEPQTLEKQLRGDMDWITMKAMEKERTRRYASASELAADIRRHLRDEPVVASPPGFVYRLRKFVRRHKGPVTATLALVLCLIAGLSLSTALYLRAESAQREAERQKAVALHQAYVANLSAAELQLRSNEAVEARGRLFECPRILRGWEWRHLFLRTDSSLATLNTVREPSLSETSSFAFSQEGARVFWHTEHTFQGWDAATYRPVTRLNNFGTILAVSSHATRVISKTFTEGSETDHTLRVFDTETGNVIARLTGQPEVSSAAFAADGTRAVAVLRDGNLIVWDPNSGKVLTRMPGHERYVRRAAFSPDGARLVSVSSDATAKVWDVASGKLVWTLRGHTGPVCSVAFSPDRLRIATGSADGTIRTWDMQSGRLLLSIGEQHGQVYSLAYSPDAARIVAGTEDSAVRIWDALSGNLIDTLLGNEYRVTAIAFTPDGARILTAHNLGPKVRVWDASFCCGVRTLVGHEMGVTAVAFSPNESIIASASMDTTLRLWDVGSGKSIRKLPGHKGSVTAVAFSPDSKLLVSGSTDKTIRIWNVMQGEVVRTISAHHDRVTSVAFSPDGTRLVTGSRDETIKIWDVASGKLLITIAVLDPVNSVGFSPDGRRLVSGSGDENGRLRAGPAVRVWDASSGKAVVEMMIPGGGPEMLRQSAAAVSVAYSPDGSRVVAAINFNRIIGIWNATNGTLTGTIRQPGLGIPGQVVFHPDGTRIFSSTGNAIRIWDATSLGPLLVLSNHPEKTLDMLCVALSSNGARMVSGSQDKTVRIWDTRSDIHPQSGDPR